MEHFYPLARRTIATRNSPYDAANCDHANAIRDGLLKLEYVAHESAWATTTERLIGKVVSVP